MRCRLKIFHQRIRSSFVRIFALLALSMLISASDQPENSSAKPAEKKITVAIYPFKVQGVDKSYGPVLTTLLTSKLSQSSRITVIESSMVDEVLKKLNFANSDLCDNTQCQLQVGKLTPAQKIIAPELSRLGEKYIVSTRVIDIQKGEIDFGTETKRVCKEDDLDELIEDASLDIREKFGEKIEGRPAASQAKGSSAAQPSSPGSAAALADSGTALSDKGQQDQAVQEFNKAIELDPNSARAFLGRGIAYVRKDIFDQAISDCTKAIQLDPKLAAAYGFRGYAYFREKQNQLALSDCSKAIELDPKDKRFYMFRGAVYTAIDQWKPAIQDYTTAIELDPNYADAYYVRGMCYNVLGKTKNYQEDLRKAKQLDPQKYANLK